MKNKLSVLLALLFLLCTAMCCEEFEEYIPCQVTLTGIRKVEHLDNAGSVPVAPVGGVVSRQAYMLRIPLDFEYEKEIVEGTYYEYILTDTIANIQIISLTAYDESHPAGTDVNELFMNYPLRQEDQLTDYKYGYMYGTVFYKIPRTLPQAGVHRFKIVVTTRKGEEFTKETDEITMQ